MYLLHFGLKHAILGKNCPQLWDDGQLKLLSERFEWLLKSPGIGLLTADSGAGKTVALRHLLQGVSPHTHKVIYLAETDFGRLDLYRSLAIGLGLDPPHRRAQLWREIKARILDLADNKQIVPLWVIDEAQNLPVEFFRDFPSFLNFAIDSRDLLTVWLVGHPSLARTLEKTPHAALYSRIHVHLHLRPIIERERFMSLIHHAFAAAGAKNNLMSDSGMELLRQACQGIPRLAGQILQMALQLAAAQKLNHLPDELLRQAIDELR